MATSTTNAGTTRDGEPQMLLIAQVRAHLVTGDTLDLIPIKHESNVKQEVQSLIQSWSDSGFLLHGRIFYPWHQVRQVEVMSVERVAATVARTRLNELYSEDRIEAQEAFWHTRQATAANSEKQGE